MRVECTAIVESLVDCARVGRELSAAAQAHVLTCEACAARWEGELSLSNGFAGLRSELGGRRSAYIRRTEVLQKFDAQYPKRTSRPWLSLAAAAALLLGVGAGVIVRNQSVESADPVLSELSEAQIEMQEAGFIAVPFVPPLAPGELVHMVHTQLQPGALASMGVNVDPALSADLPADLLLGADGFPRAVRISDESVSEGGY